GICGDGDEDKYSPVGTGMKAKTPPRALRAGNGEASSAHSPPR
ncbi:hypothetical protein A2U01_0117379, partial [Trifolium medium]|nr:hypothetical protein [Trifolium medium]